MINPDRIVCTCANLTEAQIKNYFKNNNKYRSFEEFLNDSKAGTYCTACRLDLETIFIKNNLTDQKFDNVNYSNEKSIKNRIYESVDKIFPKITLKNQNYFPILNFKGKSLRQEIWITNMEVISEKLKNEIKINDVQVFIYLYNQSGKKVWQTHDVVKVNKRVIIEIPSEKINNDQDLSIGYIEVVRKFKINCSKGTTRPQIMVFSKNSHCAVHGQDVQFTNGSSHSSIYRPNIDIQILSFINPSDDDVEIILGAPLAIDEENHNHNLKSLKINIPPRGSIAHIINHDKRFKFLEDKYFSIDWKGVGRYKSHIYCMSKNFGFISLDHL